MNIKVYISGALTGINDPKVRLFYETQARICEWFGAEAYLPHKASDPYKHTKVSDAQVYRMDKHQVCSSMLIIANVTLPSLGVGQEIEIAAQYNIPILLVSSKNASVSRMAKGNPSIIHSIQYRNLEDAIIQLTAFMSTFLGSKRYKLSHMKPFKSEMYKSAE